MNRFKASWSRLLAWQKILAVLSTLLVLHALFGFVILPAIIRYAVVTQLPPLLHRSVHLKDVYCNPFTFEISIDGFAIREQDESRDFIAFDKFYANLQPVSLVKMALVLTDVRLDAPRIFLRAAKDGSFNTDDLAASGNKTATEPKSEPFIPPIIVEPFQIQNGTIVLEDQLREVTHTVDQINFDIPKFSSRKKDWTTFMEPVLAFRVNGAPFHLKGQTMPFHDSLKTEFTLDLVDLELPTYWTYVPASKDLKLTNGTLALESKLTFEQHENILPTFSLQGTIRGSNLIMREHESTVFSAQKAEITMDDISILNLHLGLKQVLLEEPFIHIVRRQNGSINWAQYFAQPAEHKKTATQENATAHSVPNATVPDPLAANMTAANATNNAPTASAQGTQNATAHNKAQLLLKIPEIRISGGKITFDDLTMGEKFSKSLANLDLHIGDLSTAANSTATANLSTQTGQHEDLGLNATFSIAPLAFTAQITARNIDVPSYKAYFQKSIPLELNQAKVDAGITFEMRDSLPKLENSSIQIRDLQLAQPGKPGKIAAQRIALDKIGMDMTGRKVHTGNLTIDGASLTTDKDAYGRAGILMAFDSGNTTGRETPAPAHSGSDNATSGKGWEVQSAGIVLRNASLRVEGAGAKEPIKVDKLDVGAININTGNRSASVGDISLTFGLDVARTKDGQIDLAALFASPATQQTQKAAPQQPAASAWTAGISSFVLQDSRISLTDEGIAKPVTIKIDQIAASAKSLSTDLKKNIAVLFSCRVENSGTISAKADLTPEPFASKGNLKLSGIPLETANPYLADLANIALASGKLSTDLNWTVNDKMQGKISGELGADSLRVNESQNKAEVAGFSNLKVQNINLQLDPLTLTIGSVQLQEPRASFSIDQKGNTTLDRIAGKQDDRKEPKKDTPPKQNPAKTQTAKDGGLQKFSISKFTMTKGKFAFSDQSLSPKYQTSISPVDLTVSNISLDPDQRSDLELKAVIDGSAPLDLKGWIAPLKDPFEANSSVSLKNLDLVTLSPYSSKFIAYPVSRGQLNWDMSINAQDNNLAMSNSIKALQLELGDKVESPDAANVPVKLGLSLLRDTSGNIAINLPVKGDLKDPKFNVGGIVMQAFLGLIVKAVASPFTILGSLIPDGGGQGMDKLEFPAGISTPAPEMMKTLESMAKVMTDRPGLSISLRGNVDPKADTTGLMDVYLTRKLQALKFDDLSRREQEKTKLEAVVITPEEYPDLLWQAYKDEPMEKEKNAIGLVKDVPREVQESKMREAAKVTEEALIRLAGERAEHIKNILVQEFKVDAGRIFLTNASPQSLTGTRDVAIDVRQ